MKLATAGIAALVLGTGLVVTAPFANAQDFTAQVNDLKAKLQDFRSTSSLLRQSSSSYLVYTEVDTEETKERKLQSSGLPWEAPPEYS